MTRVTLTEEYVLVETDDIDFSILRLAVQEHYKQVAAANTNVEINIALIT